MEPTYSYPKPSRLLAWLLAGQVREAEGPYEKEEQVHHQHSWWQVMCLTGVDYFSTLGYQPSIAMQAAIAMGAGALAPIATLWLVLLTVFGARPMYQKVAEESPHGDGSLSMIERIVDRYGWRGKLIILAIFAFVAMCFIYTITLSGADGAKHIMENDLFKAVTGLQGDETPVRIGLTLFLIGLLGGIFLKGFKEAVWIAIPLVVTYIGMTIVIILWCAFIIIFRQSQLIGEWQVSLAITFGSPLAAGGAGLLLFPKLALGLSGFETGVLVMPLIKGDGKDDPMRPVGRIRNTKKLLLWAALIMSGMLIAVNFVVSLLIPAGDIVEGGPAAGRALAYIAERYIGPVPYVGPVFVGLYDLSTILILWFAGASAMAGLLYITPRYLPRYGMAPEWTRATRPLVLVYTTLAFIVTIIFQAEVESQAGAYATGVLAIILSSTVAVTYWSFIRRSFMQAIGFGLITCVFIYTFGLNVYERPSGIIIAGIFFLITIIVCWRSRFNRSYELRVEEVKFESPACEMLAQAIYSGERSGKKKCHIVLHAPNGNTPADLRHKDQEIRRVHSIPTDVPVPIVSMYKVLDPSQFIQEVMTVKGRGVGEFSVLSAETHSVSNAIAAFLIHLALEFGVEVIHANFDLTDEDPISNSWYHVVWGDGATAEKVLRILKNAKARNSALRGVEFHIDAGAIA